MTPAAPARSADVVWVERVVAAPPAAVFALLADARRHPDIDGSGTVRRATGDPQPLVLGAEFGMGMRWLVPYAMKNRVVEFEQDRRIAWQTVPAYPLADRVAAGRIWRYELEPVDGGTLVRESWDISQEKPLTKPLVRRIAAQTQRSMARTLERIEELLR